MTGKSKHTVGHKVRAEDYVLIGSYAGSPEDWWIAQAVYVDPRLEEIVLRRRDIPGGGDYLQVVAKDQVRAVAHPTDMQIAAEPHGNLAVSVRILGQFKAQATAACAVAKARVQEASELLDRARADMWAELDQLYLEEA